MSHDETLAALTRCELQALSELAEWPGFYSHHAAVEWRQRARDSLWGKRLLTRGGDDRCFLSARQMGLGHAASELVRSNMAAHGRQWVRCPAKCPVCEGRLQF